MDPNANTYPLKARGPDVLWDAVLARRPHLVYDIGANNGGSSRTMADRAGAIHAFEPVPDMYAKLEGVAAAYPNIAPFRLGMSDEPGIIRRQNVFNAWTLLPTDAAVDRAAEYSDTADFDVEMTTIDAHSATHGDPDFIKLDVDGYELRVLVGGMETLKRKPCPIFFEYSYLPAKFLGDSISDMCRLIYHLGYRAWSLDGEYCAESAGQMLKRYPEHTSYDVMLVQVGDSLMSIAQPSTSSSGLHPFAQSQSIMT